MAMSKKIFVGSLFEFSKLGADEVIEKFRQALPDSSSAPFITYDKVNRVFTCSIDGHNSNIQTQSLTENLTAALGAFIDFQNGKQKDLVDVPRLQNIDGTLARDEVQRSRTITYENPTLLDVDHESQDSEDDSSLDNITTYWRPEDGDFHILTNDIAAAIADSTNCVLIAEPLEKRIRLFNGDTQSALSRLKNLEHLMMLAARHRSPSESSMNANIIVLRNCTKDESIKFVRPTHPHCGYERIVLDPSQRQLITKAMVIESRFREPTGIDIEKPINLDLVNVQHTVKTSRSSRFTTDPLHEYGKAINADSQVIPQPISEVPATAQRLSVPTKFMGLTEANRVTAWNRNVDPEAGADLAPPTPVPDEPNFTRRRVVAEDSDDSDDSDDEDVPGQPFLLAGRQFDSIPDPGETDTFSLDENLPPSPETSSPCQERKRDGDVLTSDLHNDLAAVAYSRHDESDKSECYDPPYDHQPTNNIFGALSVANDESRPASPQKSAYDVQSSLALIDFDSELRASTQEPDAYLSDGDNDNGFGFQVVTKGKKSSFDPTKYTTKSAAQLQSRPRHGTKSRGRGGSQQAHQPAYGGYHGRTASLTAKEGHDGRGTVTRLSTRGSSHQRGRGRAQGRSNQVFETRTRDENLIDVSVEPTGEAPRIPPGFAIRSHFPKDNLMRVAPDRIEAPALPPSLPARRVDEWISDSATSVTTPVAPMSHSFRPNLGKRNIEVLRQQTLAKLTSKIRQADRHDGPLPPERLQMEEEADSRIYHGTMNQQAPPPRKKGPKLMPGQQESRQEREARIAKAKAEAYGETSPAGSATRSNTKPVNLQPERMSARKSKLIRVNPTMAALHTDIYTKQAITEQTEKMYTALKPIFEAACAFSGELVFEIQIGQALVIKTDKVKDTLHKQKDWAKLLDPDSPSSAPVKFTSILTSNGGDVDRALEIRGADDSTRVWSENSDGGNRSVFEFLCLDKSGSNFVVTLDTARDLHVISRPKTIIGKVALHCPDQIWDACAVLHGSTEWTTVTEVIKEGVTQLVASIRVSPAPSGVAVYYRQPLNNAFNVQDVSLKSLSIHTALAADQHELQLHVTENQALIHNTHPVDKGLHRSHAAKYEKMVANDRIYYGMSIMNTAINRTFSEHNAVLEIGSLTDISCTGSGLLKQGRLRSLVEMTTHMIDRMDWMGAANNGTYKRLDTEDLKRKQTINVSIPPQALTQVGPATSRPVYMGQLTAVPPANLPATVSRSAFGGGATAMADTQTPRIIHGVRANTTAELYYQDGQYFYLGINGARVPALNVHGANGSAGANVANDPVMPDDSASQAGGNRARGDHRFIRGRTKLTNIWENKPDGYW